MVVQQVNPGAAARTAAPPARGTVRRSRRAPLIAALDVLWVVVLVALLHLHWRGTLFFDDLDDPVGGLLPLVVPWAGALGGVMVSLVGAARHSHDWDDRWTIWHLIRPVAGAVAATVAFALLQIVLATVDATADQSGTERTAALFDGALTPAEIGLYGGTAFVVGFVDKVFLDLVGRVAGVLFANGDPADVAPFAFSLDRQAHDFGDVPAGSSESETLVLTFSRAADGTPASGWSSSGGPDAAAFHAREAMWSLHGAEVVVTFAPPSAGRDYEAVLVLGLQGMTRSVPLRGRGA